MTVKDVVIFILKYRKGKICRDWSLPQICDRVTLAIKNELFYYTEKDGVLTGIVWGSMKSPNVLYIEGILTIDKDSFKDFLKVLRDKFQDIELEAHRRAKYVKYNTERLAYGRNNTNRSKQF